jgi:forkhead transcription factor HCM1
MMSSTRYQRPPLQIYQDPVSSDHAPIPSMKDTTSKAFSPLRPIKNASSRRNIIFNPPTSDSNYTSPLKAAQHSSSSPLRDPFSNKLNMISMPPQGGLGHQTDSLKKKEPVMSKFKTVPQKALFATSNITHTGKENYHPAIAPAPARFDYQPQNNFENDSIYGRKPQNKRVLLEAAPIEESKPAEKPKVEPEPVITATEQFPVLNDDGSKPPHSYAMLIGMAILRAPNRRLTLAQIYKWISDTYSYYNAADAGWQNSIRHNLSLNKAFVKQERPKDDPGKGNYWAIEAGKEKLFTKDKPVRKGTINETASILSTTVTPAGSQEPHHPTYKILTPAPQELPPTSSSFMLHQSIAPVGAELSSDATIPLSDVVIPEEEPEEEDFIARQAVYPPIPSSPPPMMHSSPPVPRQVQNRENTPPPVPRFPTSSRTRSHKRNFASMDDSGYYSSLNSSALRCPQGERRLTLEADRPRIKRGRAEEEIARLRGSSYDSPTKGRTFMSQSAAFVPVSSSPIRRGLAHDSSQMLPPLTPAVKLKAPARPPPSVSPNTNLRMHRDRVRQLVGSPDRGLTDLDENLPWSPAFNLDPHVDAASFTDISSEFDIFADTNSGLLNIPGTSSPGKRPTKRSRLDQVRSPRILGDISNTNFNRGITSTPMPKFSPTLAPSAFESPSKYFDLATPIKFNSPSLSMAGFDMPQDFANEDWYGAEFLADEVTEFSGMDILQGFKKIGAGGHSHTPKANDSRPALGRCFTSLF